jgi:hypothetical protein
MTLIPLRTICWNDHRNTAFVYNYKTLWHISKLNSHYSFDFAHLLAH